MNMNGQRLFIQRAQNTHPASLAMEELRDIELEDGSSSSDLRKEISLEKNKHLFIILLLLAV